MNRTADSSFHFEVQDGDPLIIGAAADLLERLRSLEANTDKLLRELETESGLGQAGREQRQREAWVSELLMQESASMKSGYYDGPKQSDAGAAQQTWTTPHRVAQLLSGRSTH